MLQDYVLGLMKGSFMITISEVEEAVSNSEIMTFWFFVQLWYIIRILCSFVKPAPLYARSPRSNAVGYRSSACNVADIDQK